MRGYCQLCQLTCMVIVNLLTYVELIHWNDGSEVEGSSK